MSNHDKLQELNKFLHKCTRCGLEVKSEKRHNAPAGTGNACGKANACLLCKGHEGPHEDWRGDKW